MGVSSHPQIFQTCPNGTPKCGWSERTCTASVNYPADFKDLLNGKKKKSENINNLMHVETILFWIYWAE